MRDKVDSINKSWSVLGSDGEYVISTGVIGPGGFVPDYYHQWEDQTLHVIERELDAKIGEECFRVKTGHSIHCPRGVSHYMKNLGDSPAKLINYIFPANGLKSFWQKHRDRANPVSKI